MKDHKSKKNLASFLAPLTAPLSDESTLYRLAHNFSTTYTHLAACSTEHFFPTPITHLPTGRERGRYLAVYVGLFYLHVGFIELLGERQYENGNSNGNSRTHHSRDTDNDVYGRLSRVRRTLEKAWPISETLKREHPVEFFAWIGSCIAQVVGDSLRRDRHHPGHNKVGASRIEGQDVDDKDGEEEVVAGISFCFPIMQKSLDEAVLLPTGKGFALTSDLNLRQALLDGYECHVRESPENSADEQAPNNDGYDSDSDSDDGDNNNERNRRKRRKFVLPKLKIAAMTNDTVATFASLAYSSKAASGSRLRNSDISAGDEVSMLYQNDRNNSRVVMGLMVGAGCNATVPMKLSKLHAQKTEFITRAAAAAAAANATPTSGAKPQTEKQEQTQIETLVSSEWTLFPCSKPLIDMSLLTHWDKHISSTSEPPSFQPMEYMVGGRYMGELTRLIVLEYFTSILNYEPGILPWRLQQSGGLTTEFLSLTVASSSSSSSSSTSFLPKTTASNSCNSLDDSTNHLVTELNKSLPSTQGWTWNAEKANILKTVAYAVQSRSTAVIAAATVGLLACTGEIELKDPSASSSPPPPPPPPTTTARTTSTCTDASTTKDDIEGSRSGTVLDWTQTQSQTPEELIVAFSGGLIQNYPLYKENLQRHIDRLLVHGGPQPQGKSILLREVSDGGIIGVGVLAGCSMPAAATRSDRGVGGSGGSASGGGIEEIVGSRLVI